MCTIIPFYKVNPSGNMTLLFEGLHYTQEEKQHIALTALHAQHLFAEQAGFIDIQKGQLCMAGNEFCVNATRALALLMAKHAHIDTTNSWEGTIHTSGFDAPICVRVCNNMPAQSYNVTLRLPLTNIPQSKTLGDGFNLITLPGIEHILIDTKILPFDAQSWKEQAQQVRNTFALHKNSAIGCIWWDESTHATTNTAQEVDTMHLTAHPIVMVPTPYTECYENACGSGSVALALVLHEKFAKTSFYIHQPGGYLHIELKLEDKAQCYALISGPVNIVASGQAYL